MAASGASHVPQHNGVCGPKARKQIRCDHTGQWPQYPLFFFTLLFSQLVALIRFLPCGNHSIAEVCNYYEPSFRSFATVTYSIANQAAEPVETPNIHPQVHDIGQCMFYVLYFGTTATGVVWLYHLTTMYRSSTFATTRGRRYRETHTLPASETDGCSSSTVNVDADAGDGYCIGNVPFMSWVMYAMMILSEFVSFVSGLLFSFSMWRPICRGARYMNDFELPTPRNSGRWSTSCCVTTWNRSRIRCKH